MDSLLFFILVVALTLTYKRIARKKQKEFDAVGYQIAQNQKGGKTAVIFNKQNHNKDNH